ncbi:hypothetical protein [Streptomyces sp. NPDC046385]|uniref:hypothetical protein n=1 Tax=Streptomyces sp. NPDC046385 TaxID=3154918 RepID=UPI0033F1A8CF
MRQSLAMLEGLIDHLEHMASTEAALAADLKAAEQEVSKALGERERLVSAHHGAVSARLRAEAECGRANGRAAELAAGLRDAESARGRALEELHEARSRELAITRSVHAQEIMRVSGATTWRSTACAVPSRPSDPAEPTPRAPPRGRMPTTPGRPPVPSSAPPAHERAGSAVARRSPPWPYPDRWPWPAPSFRRGRPAAPRVA